VTAISLEAASKLNSWENEPLSQAVRRYWLYVPEPPSFQQQFIFNLADDILE
tara:strand:- start:701 stop:856 length:156 start_codon:yes stop_codon:yes gene_type:complete